MAKTKEGRHMKDSLLPHPREQLGGGLPTRTLLASSVSSHLSLKESQRSIVEILKAD
jgi:hypothetical protein